MSSYTFYFEKGQKIARNLSYFPQYLGGKKSQYFKMQFHSGMWYDPNQYPQLDGKNNVLFGMLYRGAWFSRTYAVNIFYWGWKPAARQGMFEIYANVCVDVTKAPKSQKVAEVAGRELLLFKFTNTAYYGFGLDKYVSTTNTTPLGFWQQPATGADLWMGYNYPPTMELQNGSPMSYYLKIEEVATKI